MAYFMHLAIWPPKSSLTSNSEELSDFTVDYEEGGSVKFGKWAINNNFELQKLILFVT